MGMRTFAKALLGFLLLPIWVRMQAWRLKIRHPDPRWMETQSELYEADHRERVWPGKPPITVGPGRPTWRPDPSAQVDEIKAQLVDSARAPGPGAAPQASGAGTAPGQK